MFLVLSNNWVVSRIKNISSNCALANRATSIIENIINAY